LRTRRSILLGKPGRLLPATNSPLCSLVPSRNATIENLLPWAGHQMTGVRVSGSSVSHRPSACWRAFSSAVGPAEAASRIVSVGPASSFNRAYAKSRQSVRRTTSSSVLMISFGPLPIHIGGSVRIPTKSFTHVFSVLISSACPSGNTPVDRNLSPTSLVEIVVVREAAPKTPRDQRRMGSPEGSPR
jgi:hypothetical protein